MKVAALHHADGPAPGPPAPDDRSLATRCLRAVTLARRSSASLEPVTPADSDTSHVATVRSGLGSTSKICNHANLPNEQSKAMFAIDSVLQCVDCLLYTSPSPRDS